jgi:putative membrane-bound dehydrogenase-like protein
MHRIGLALFASSLVAASSGPADERPAAPFQVGVAKVDLTPQRPLRLSGYSNRNRPYEAVDEPIFVRTLALRDPSGELTVWSSVELLGVTGEMRTAVLAKLEGIDLAPERFSLCATHTHTAPHVRGVAPNLFAPRMEAAEIEAMNAYTDEAIEKIARSIRLAVADLKPARLRLAWGEVGFAVNRRVLDGGKWTGFGVQADGPTDRRLPVLAATSPDGSVRAIVYGYACHATTLGGEHNRLGGDWPGAASAELERRRPGAVALGLIGCGADANPEPRGSLELARRHGRALADAAEAALGGEWVEIDEAPTATYGFAGLAPVRPSVAELTLRLASPNAHIRQHAQDMMNVLQSYGRIPETYPCPIQIYRFGDQFTMIFLGGEVVVDYALRLTRELADAIPSGRLWVAAYSNDVFAYVASERMRREGGYEFDYSMYFYNQPGPWEEGTEDLLVRRVHELLEHPEGEGNLPPERAIQTMFAGEGLEVELVAAEPLVADPVNLAFGPDGRLWVAEMGDYPKGGDGRGSPGGRVRCLEDADGDGRIDKSTLVLEGLTFTTGAHPWRDGAIVSSTPEIFYAEVSPNGSVSRRPLVVGFAVGNPQHVVTGFSMGLDNWLYFCGDELGTVESASTGKKVPLAGRDGRVHPDTGEVEAESGVTQHVRCRNDWGDWFGGANYCPFWHYVLEDRYVRRNAYVATPRPWQDLYDGFYPKVYPKSRIVFRFNDLFTIGRFSSACSPSPYRDELLGEEEYILACEPVHNLVHRAVTVRNGLEFLARRTASEAESEFLASSDPWFRPVRAITGPDGAVYVADMYRLVIEHPNWIPDAWKARLDLRAGADKGRIYRVAPKGRKLRGPMLPRLDRETPEQLVRRLESPNGWQRDMAQQLLIAGGWSDRAPLVREIAARSPSPKARLNALGTLLGWNALTAGDVLAALRDEHPAVRVFGCRLAESQVAERSELFRAVAALADDPEIHVRFQAANTLGEWKDDSAAAALAKILERDLGNEWIQTAVLSSATHHPEAILREVLAMKGAPEAVAKVVDGLLATTVGVFGKSGLERVLAEILPADGDAIETWRVDALAGLLDCLDRRNMSLAAWAQSAGEDAPLLGRLKRMFAHAVRTAGDEDADQTARLASVRLLARGPSNAEEERTVLTQLLAPTQPAEIQRAAVAELGRLSCEEVPAVLFAAWRSFGPSVRSDAVSVLLSRPQWTPALLGAIEEGTIRASELDAARRRELLEHADRAIKSRAQALFESAADPSRAEVLAARQSAATLAGDAARGREQFLKHCAACHRFGGLGNDVGPNLETFQDRSPANLLVAVLDPNRAVEARYTGYTIQTTDGRVLSGMIVNETSGSLTLARPDGKIERVARVDIEEMASSGKSFMPEGFEKDLSDQQLADLFAFLAQPPERK